MPRELSTVGVIGLGTMGAGIAEVFARNGFDVIGLEQSEELLERGRGHVTSSTDRAVRRGKLEAADQQALLDRLTLTSSLSDLKDCDLVVEAVVERLDLKLAIFQQLDDIVRPDAILATNTSSLSVTEIAAATAHPGRLVGMHFFNPAPVQRLVEVVHTVVTEPGVVDDMQAVARRLGKNPVVVGDSAGFIANALLFGYLNHAAALYQTRAASREDLDAAMTKGCGYPLGPLALLDLIGLDTAYAILETMYAESRDRLHAPAPVLKHLVTAGLLGRKSGRGFYTYEAAHSSKVAPDALTPPGDEAPQLRRPITEVAVAGTGSLADGIADLFSGAGFDVVRMTGDDASALATADLVVVAGEDGDENEDALRSAAFRTMARGCKSGAILATTTTRSVIELAAVAPRPADVVGLRFVPNYGSVDPSSRPAMATELVEVVHTTVSGGEVIETVKAVCRMLGKHPITSGDRAGYVVDALLFPYLNDAVRMLEAHYASADDIDTAMKQGCALPRGPFEVLEAVGADRALAVQQRLYDQTREPGLAPAPLLAHLVAAGRPLPR